MQAKAYVGAIFVDRRPGKGSTGFCWINIKRTLLLLLTVVIIDSN
jgi:hypothetical protein